MWLMGLTARCGKAAAHRRRKRSPSPLRERAPAAVRVGMETGPLAVWHWHGLRTAGVPVVCLHARQAAAALALQTNKTDDSDAFGLAQLVRSGWYRPVQIKSLENHRLRAMLTARAKLVSVRTGLTNTIRGLCKTFGVVLGPGRNSRFTNQVREVLTRKPDLSPCIEPLLLAWEGADGQLGEGARPPCPS